MFMFFKIKNKIKIKKLILTLILSVLIALQFCPAFQKFPHAAVFHESFVHAAVLAFFHLRYYFSIWTMYPMVKVPIQIGAVEGIITFIGISKNFKINANDIVNKLEKIKLIKRNFILFLFLIGNACGGICSCGGIFFSSCLKLCDFSGYGFFQISFWHYFS